MAGLSGKVLFATALAAGVCIGWFIRFPPTDSASAASWAQAFGTVGAIVGTVMVTRMQMRHAVDREETARKRDIEERLFGVLDVTHKLFNATGRAQKVIEGRLRAGSDYREAVHGYVALADGGVKALNEIPLHIPPYTSIAREIIVLQRAFYLYRRRVAKLLERDADVEANLVKAQAILSRMRREWELLNLRVDRALRVRGDRENAG